MTEKVVLVTGFGGLIGGAVARRLFGAGRSIVAADIVPFAGFSFPTVEQDLTDWQRWHDIISRFNITDVVHAGGISGPMLLRDQPARICAINLQALTALLEAARIHGLRRIVWFSSIAAYGNRSNLDPVHEESPLNPETVYAATKAAGEALLKAYHAEHGVDGIALRVASCYGPGRTTACLIRTIIEDGLAGHVTTVKDSAGRSRQHIFVDDVVTAVVAALDAPPLPQRVYNIGPGRMQSLNEIVTGIKSVVPHATITIRDDGLAWNTFGLGPMTINAARRDLGFEPRTSISEGAERTRIWVERHRSVS